MASIELGSVSRVCRVVSNLVPPTLRVTTLFRDEEVAGGLLGSGSLDILALFPEKLHQNSIIKLFIDLSETIYLLFLY